MKRSGPDQGRDYLDIRALPEIERNYLKAYPETTFPQNISDLEKFNALMDSHGTKIVFTNGKQGVHYYFEEEHESPSIQIKDLKKFLGCGG